jgi:hypothetical protein
VLAVVRAAVEILTAALLAANPHLAADADLLSASNAEHRAANRIIAKAEQLRRAIDDYRAAIALIARSAAAAGEVEVRLVRHGVGTLLELQHRPDSGAPWAGGVGAGREARLLMFDVRFRGDDPSTIPATEAFPKLDALWTELVAAGG